MIESSRRRRGYEISRATKVKATSGDYRGFDVNIGEHDWKNGRRAFPRQGDIKNYHNKDDIGEYYGFDRDIGYRKRRIGMFGNRIVAGGTWVTAPVYYGQAGESANSVRYMRM